MIRVLFICTGNICRSPTAEGVFQALVDHQGLGAHIDVDSAGTQSWHQGNAPDARSIEAAARRGVKISHQKSRPIVAADYTDFDYLLAMDGEHFEFLSAKLPEDAHARIALLLDFAPAFSERDVPDPYYGGPGGFENVLDMIEAASHGLLAEIRKSHFDTASS